MTQTTYQIEVILLNEQNLTAPTEQQFQQFLQPLANHFKLQKTVCINIITPAESQQLNHQYRAKNKPTNVLSFTLELPEFVKSPQLGDLAICAEVVETEAQQQQKNLTHHWTHLSIHGCLHLLGYDHQQPQQAQTMENLEIQLLKQLQIPNPYH